MRNNANHVLRITEIRNNDGDDSLWLHQASTKDQILFVLLSTSWNWGKMLKTEVTTKKSQGFESGWKDIKAATH